MPIPIFRTVRGWLAAGLLVFAGTAAAAGGARPALPLRPADTPLDASEAMFVEVTRIAPDIRVDMRYATPHNFTKQAIYPKTARCYLRRPAAEKLVAVQKQLAAQGLGLKVYDCYRPLSAQARLWAVVHDERYVADPKKGSRHNRGAAVDLTLVDASGRELPMPTAYDDFTVKAHRDYMQLPEAALRNRAVLEAAMSAQGFVPLSTEWWHFDYVDAHKYPMADIGFDELVSGGKP